MKKVHLLLTLAAAVVLFGIACGDSNEKAYLDSVNEALALSRPKFEKFGELFGQAWPLPSQLFNALEEAGAGTAFDATLVALEKLEPPQRFEADHELLVSSTREVVSHDKAVGQSVVDQDLTAFVLANVAMGQASARGTLALSKPVCEALNSHEEVTDPHLCQRLRPGQGAAYGEELYKLMSVLAVDFWPKVNVSVPSFGAQGGVDILARFKPDIVRVLEETSVSVSALEPPDEFQRDHERLLSYLDEVLENARAIPEVPTNRPVAGAGPLEGREGPPLCTAKDDLSKEFLELVITYFGDPMCDGSGPDGGPPSGPPPPR